MPRYRFPFLPSRSTRYWRSGSFWRNRRAVGDRSPDHPRAPPRRPVRTGGCRSCGSPRSCSGRCGVASATRTRRHHQLGRAPEWRRGGRRSRTARADGRRRASGCRAVRTGYDPGAAGIDGGVGERDPAREVLLRLDERVAVVLVPREATRLLGLLVDELVPVEPDVGPIRSWQIPVIGCAAADAPWPGASAVTACGEKVIASGLGDERSDRRVATG